MTFVLASSQFYVISIRKMPYSRSLLHNCEFFANLRLNLYSAGIRISSVYQWSYNWPTAWLAARFPVRWPDHNLISTRKQHNSKQQGYQPTATSCRVWILNSFFPGLLVNVNLYTDIHFTSHSSSFIVWSWSMVRLVWYLTTCVCLRPWDSYFWLQRYWPMIKDQQWSLLCFIKGKLQNWRDQPIWTSPDRRISSV